MIPKIIHYCWFGGKEKPKDVLRMIASWKKHCPDYEIKEWNETNFDIHINRYCEEAYQQKKWAFVSDVARLWALYHEGGIYMDTDVEVVRPLDPLLSCQGFLGFEGTQWIATSIMGVKPHHPLIEKFLASYQQKHFILPDGSLEVTTNVRAWTKLLKEQYGLVLNGKKQQVGDFTIYPTDYFTPYDYINGKLTQTANTYSIHWFGQSWVGLKDWRKKIAQWFHRIQGLHMK